MAENILTAPEQQAELDDIQARLGKLLANAQDDQSKKQIFKQIIVPLTDSLPDVPPANGPALPSDNARHLLGAIDKLTEAARLAEFIQSISLNAPGGELLLQPGQLSGFYFAMETTIGRIREAEALINTARAHPEAMAA